MLGLLKKGPLPPQTAVPFSFQAEPETRKLTFASFSTQGDPMRAEAGGEELNSSGDFKV